VGKKKTGQLHRLLILLKEGKQWQQGSGSGPFICLNGSLVFNYGLSQVSKTADSDKACDLENLVGGSGKSDTQVRGVVSKEVVLSSDILLAVSMGQNLFFLLFHKPRAVPKVTPLLWRDDHVLVPEKPGT